MAVFTDCSIDVERVRNITVAQARSLERANTSTTTTAAAPETTPTTTAGANEMDRATVRWWLDNPSLQSVACDVGISVVQQTEGDFIDGDTFARLCAGEDPRSPSSAPSFTADELNSILGPAAQAWAVGPSATYDALAAAARTIVESRRTLLPELVDDGGELPSTVLNRLTSYPGSDREVIRSLHQLALVSPVTLGEGSYLVNSEVPPGTYRAVDVSGCYWETLDSAGEINDNNFVNDAPQVLMVVRESDYAVNNECSEMVKID